MMMANMALPTDTPGGVVRPLKKAAVTHMAKPVTVKTTDYTMASITNNITVEISGEVVIQRVTYSLAGQAIAVRVTGDPDPTNNGLFYLHSDHLGSVSAMSDVNGNLVLDSTARYTPFGDWRTEPGTNPR